MKIVGINGINSHGDGNVDLVLHLLRLRGFETVDVRLPKRHWFSARWGGKADGRIVAHLSNEGDILVAHSYGAVRAWYAHKLREYKAIFVIAPAQSSNVIWWTPERVICYYSSIDWVISLGALLPFHPFGRAGVEGYHQSGITNIEVQGSDHNDYFKGAPLIDIVERIALWAAK